MSRVGSGERSYITNGVSDVFIQIQIPALTCPYSVRLDAEQRELTQNCLSQFIPILEREANKASGEIFPVVWYHGDGERTAVQFFELARAMMLAENPNLRYFPLLVELLE